MPGAWSARLQKAFCQSAEEVRAGDHAGHVPVVDDGDDQDAVVKEDLGELGVGVVGADVDVFAVDVLSEALAAAAGAFLERLVERAVQEGQTLHTELTASTSPP
jgi:hypothetical protein